MIAIKSEASSLFRKFLTSKIPITKTRNLSTEKVADNVADKNTSDIPPNDQAEEIKTTKDVEKIFRYFKSSNLADKVDSLPFTILKQRKSRPELLYLFDEEIADNFVDLIKDDLLDNPRKVVEVNAGAGVLTERLLAAGIPKLSIMEPQSKCVQAVGKLQQKYPDRIKIQEADLFNMWRIAHQDKQDGGGRVAKVLSGFTQIQWNKRLGLQIIGALPNINFIRHLILDVVRQCGIVSCGRPRLYLCLPPKVWWRLTCDHTAASTDYRAIAVLFQLFFDYKLLGAFPRKAFLPWAPYNSAAKHPRNEEKAKDNDHMYAVKIEGKENLYTDVIDEALIQPMWYFITHHMVARSGRVIPQMESWSPGCGPKLIMQDYNIYTQFGDLTPQQILQLFKDFTLWDGYHNSFIPSFENSPQKMEQLTY